MSRPTWSRLTRETEAFLSALRKMGSEKSPASKRAVVATFKDVEKSFLYLKNHGVLGMPSDSN
jgi:hypothetical protein